MFKSLIPLHYLYILLSSIILVQDVNSRHLWDHCLDTRFYCRYLEITSELYIKITNRTTAAEDVAADWLVLSSLRDHEFDHDVR